MKPVSFKPWRKTPTRSAYGPGEVLPMYPIIGTLGCCARAASGHATLVLLKSLMNSRRLMASPAPRTRSGIQKTSTFLDRELCRSSHPNRIATMSALGQKQTSKQVHAMSALPPKADIAELEEHVRFLPKADIMHCSN